MTPPDRRRPGETQCPPPPARPGTEPTLPRVGAASPLGAAPGFHVKTGPRSS